MLFLVKMLLHFFTIVMVALLNRAMMITTTNIASEFISGNKSVNTFLYLCSCSVDFPDHHSILKINIICDAWENFTRNFFFHIYFSLYIKYTSYREQH